MTAQRKIVAFLIISMLVTGPMGLLLSGHLAEFSSHLIVLGAMFILTALMLVSSEYVLKKSKLQRSMDKLTPGRAACIGFVQGLAVIPGISRSGSAIAAGLWMGLSREQATRYSFLLFIPIMIAGSLRDIVRMLRGDLILPDFWISAVSFAIAGIIGYFTIAGMIKLVSKTSLNYFAVYAALLGAVLIALYFI
jgi:undecaprenyl-diphosphatase